MLQIILILLYNMGDSNDPLMPVMEALKPLSSVFVIGLIIYALFLKDHIRKEKK